MFADVLQGNQKPFCTIDPYASLFDAIKTLIQEKVHRLPVIDPETGNVLYILTHKRILKFLFLYYYDLPLPHNLDKPIRDLSLGTFDNIATATMNTPLIDALHAFNERRVSALPVIDETGKVIDVYAKFDVIVCLILSLPLPHKYHIILLPLSFISCPRIPL
jgi:5'-AMP-activated protein kinase regulatory gamma subunit